jgi:hypothetical protein
MIREYERERELFLWVGGWVGACVEIKQFGKAFFMLLWYVSM